MQVRDHFTYSKLKPKELDSNESLNKMGVRTYEHTNQNMFAYLSHFRLGFRNHPIATATDHLKCPNSLCERKRTSKLLVIWFVTF